MKRRFTDPDRFDIHRNEGLARSLRLRAAFLLRPLVRPRPGDRRRLRVLLERTREIALVPDKLPVFRGWEFRAPTSLHVTLR